MNVICFSKDRPAQLDLLLRSIKRFAPHLKPSLIVKSTNGLAEDGYGRLHREGDLWGDWLGETTGSTLRECISYAVDVADPHTMFLMDDDVFINPWAGTLPENDDILSLRLHPKLTTCYATGSPMTPPEMSIAKRWAWEGTDGDFGYPMSLDGHVFPTTPLLSLMDALPWNNPNTLEAALASRPLASHLTCFATAKIINVPHNRVQNVYPNRHEGGSVDDLNRAFLEGKRIAIPGPGPYSSVHVPLAYEYEP